MLSHHTQPVTGATLPTSTLAHVDAAVCQELTVLQGRAWSPRATISVVEISTDGGATWEETTLTGDNDPSEGVEWEHPWRPGEAGTHVVVLRTSDSAGSVATTEPGIRVTVAPTRRLAG
ncbi:molybdopterin-binding protein [Nocardioides ochotonae]|uniref:hypothetical protein n=1 Tax=Nocardioides ochotonae TaxID=2685869 RepID=UPI00140E766E|nr:hypothetical protein [Nocardioides ochotonae]